MLSMTNVSVQDGKRSTLSLERPLAEPRELEPDLPSCTETFVMGLRGEGFIGSSRGGWKYGQG